MSNYLKGGVILKSLPPKIFRAMSKDFFELYEEDMLSYLKNKSFEYPSEIINWYFIGVNAPSGNEYWKSVSVRLKEIWEKPHNQEVIKKYKQGHV